MTRECVDEFLAENEKIAQAIKRIAENYSVADFVKVAEPVRAYVQDSENKKVDHISGCICNIRKGYLHLDMDSVEGRLTREYLEYLMEILTEKEEIEKVFYIVAYHYLTMLKQLGYQLTAASNAPFYLFGEEMCPLAKKNYKILYEKMEGNLFALVSHLYEDDLLYYNKVYRECGYSHHATKHFSLIENMVGFVHAVNRYEFDYEFEKALDVFIFKYRAIFTNQRLHVYMYREDREKVVSELVDV